MEMQREEVERERDGLREEMSDGGRGRGMG